jgi:hypothetical protein
MYRDGPTNYSKSYEYRRKDQEESITVSDIGRMA